MLSKMFSDYGKLQHHIVMLIVAEFFLQLINTSFTLILNIYMLKQGYTDSQVADFPHQMVGKNNLGKFL